MVTDKSSPVDAIKRATRDEHQRVEEVITAQFFDRSEFDRDDFRMLLATYYGLYAPFDAVLGPRAARRFRDFEYRPRAPLIEDDLRAIGMTDRQFDRLPTLDRESMVVPATLPALLGALYVVEGASLGNRVIRRRLEPQLDGVFSRADAFFHDDGSATGERWQRFRGLFNRRIESNQTLELAICSARETFAMYEEWFS